MATTLGVSPLPQQSLPAGWAFSYLNDGFVGPNNEFISRNDVKIHGSFHKAYAHVYGSQGIGVLPATGDVRNTSSGGTEVYDGNKWFPVSITGATGAVGHTTISNNITPAGKLTFGSPGTTINNSFNQSSNLTLKTEKGEVVLNLKTADITVPPGIGRDEAIRDFWLAFQKYFQPIDTVKHQHEISELKSKITNIQMNAKKEAGKIISEKIAKKYGGEKFIMVRPEDLIRFIEEG
jgi:hypothetical protein